MDSDDWKCLLRLEEELCCKLNNIDFRMPPSKIVHVYNPIDYAIQLHLSFITRFFTLPKKVLFVGMNPGPFGMAQTGVPFGDVVTSRDWLRVKGVVGKVSGTHPSKPIQGLKCSRIEVSGARFWGLFWKTLKLSPEEFFGQCFVLNVCPYLFLDANGKNISLANIIAPIRHQIEASCNSFLIEVLNLIKPEVVVGVGRYATSRVQNVISLMKTPCLLTNLHNQDFASNCSNSRSSSSLNSADQCVNAICDVYLKIPPKLTQTVNDLKVQNSSTITISPLPEIEMASDELVKRDINRPFLHHTDTSRGPRVITLMHPSPANPTANKCWETIALKQLEESGVLDLFKSKF